MTSPSGPANATVPVSETAALPAIVHQAGQAAVFAANEFFYGKIRNEHTRLAYRRAVERFLAWCESRGLDLVHIAPGDILMAPHCLRKSAKR